MPRTPTKNSPKTSPFSDPATDTRPQSIRRTHTPPTARPTRPARDSAAHIPPYSRTPPAPFPSPGAHDHVPAFAKKIPPAATFRTPAAASSPRRADPNPHANPPTKNGHDPASCNTPDTPDHIWHTHAPVPPATLHAASHPATPSPDSPSPSSNAQSPDPDKIPHPTEAASPDESYLSRSGNPKDFRPKKSTRPPNRTKSHQISQRKIEDFSTTRGFAAQLRSKAIPASATENHHPLGKHTPLRPSKLSVS